MIIPHHQGAPEMAKIEIQYGHDEQLRALAQEIVSAQEKQLSQFKGWKREN